MALSYAQEEKDGLKKLLNESSGASILKKAGEEAKDKRFTTCWALEVLLLRCI